MANNILGFPHSAAGVTLYAIIRNQTGEAWNTAGSVFQTYVTANITDYDVALSQQGTASQFYALTFPGAISAGVYYVAIYQQAGGAPAEGDMSVGEGEVFWTGTALVNDAARLENLDAAVTTRLAPTTAGRTLDVTAAGEAGIDLANVGSPGATLALSGTTIKAVTDRTTANVDQLGSSAQSLTDLKDFADSGYNPATHKVENVVLVDTTTTNTDMRGTDGAALASNYNATRAGFLDKLNVTGLVASAADISAITQAQRVRLIVPAAIERPDAGSATYRLWIYAYDEQHKAEDLDSDPTVTAENNTGTDRSSGLGTVTKPGSTTGIYYVDYTVAAAHAIEGLVFKVAATEGSVTTNYAAASLVVDTTAVDFTSADRAKLDTLHDTRLTAARAGYLDNINNSNLANVPAFPANFSVLGINASGHVSRVTLVDTLTTYTNNTPQSGDSFARIGVAGVGLTNIILPSGGLANVVAWNVAITGNITGNLSGSVGSVTGNIGGNVVGSVGSVVGNVGGNVSGSVASVTSPVLISNGSGSGQLTFVNGVVAANLTHYEGTPISATAVRANMVEIAGDGSATTGLSWIYGSLIATAVDDEFFAPTTTQFEVEFSASEDGEEYFRNTRIIWRNGSNGSIISYVTAAQFIDRGGDDDRLRLTVGTLPVAPANGDALLVMERDAEIAAVKAKTDLIPAQPAAVGSLMGLTDGAITDAKFTMPTLTGPASGPVGYLVQLWRRFFKRTKLTKTSATAGTIKTYADNGSTVVTTQDINETADEQDQGAAA